MNPPVEPSLWALGLAVASLVAGIVLFLAIVLVRRQHFGVLNPISWLLMAVFPALIIYTLFPESLSTGTVQSIKVGGAAGLFLAVWVLGVRFGRQARRGDAQQEDLDARDARISALESDLMLAQAQRGPTVLDRTVYHRYQVRSAPRSRIGLITGSLANITGIDVWVNSENTFMQMAGFYDRSVSGLIRLYGARRNEDGWPVEDLVNQALDQAMANRQRPVQGGTVVVTDPCELASRGVKKIFHVAAVHGVPGVGYKQVDNLADCVTHALARMGGPLQTIVFPLLGSGQGGGEADKTLRLLYTSALDALAGRATKASAVYFLALTDVQLEVCRRILDAEPRLKYLGT